jgi:signal transduction histidine kinase
MHPPILGSSGIESALESLCSSLQKEYALSVDFISDGQPKPMTTDVRYCLYQAVRELLLNVVKHARAETVELSIKTDNNSCTVLQVIDNGIGCNYPEAQLQNREDGGYGLYNVQNRIEQIGGRFTFESVPGAGTAVTLTLLPANKQG